VKIDAHAPTSRLLQRSAGARAWRVGSTPWCVAPDAPARPVDELNREMRQKTDQLSINTAKMPQQRVTSRSPGRA